MFVQVIQGRAKDAAGLRKQFETWNEELRPKASGFLGSTGGVSDDGEFIMVARFESADAAQQNSDRPEQDAWWKETAQYLEGEARFYDTTDVDTFNDGGSNDAGFVQIIQGTTTDRAAYEKAGKDMEPQMSEQRPDVIGGLSAWQNNDFTEVIYFTSEAEAREGERKMDAETGGGPEWQKLMTNVKYIDLREPWLT